MDNILNDTKLAGCFLAFSLVIFFLVMTAAGLVGMVTGVGPLAFLASDGSGRDRPTPLFQSTPAPSTPTQPPAVETTQPAGIETATVTPAGTATATSDPDAEEAFEGTWFTNFAELDLEQDGTEVTGTYTWYGSSSRIALRGQLDGRVLEGRFGSNPDDEFRFELSEDGRTFSGYWRRGDGPQYDWCGASSGPLPPGCGFSGEWLTTGEENTTDQATASLQQVGDQVEGEFFNGQDFGRVSGRLSESGPGEHYTVSGTFEILDSGGNVAQDGGFEWTLVNFGSQAFTGAYYTDRDDNPWCGWREGMPRPDC